MKDRLREVAEALDPLRLFEEIRTMQNHLGVLADGGFRAVYESLAAKIHYFSIKSATTGWRWISPHAFGFDGHRWHARASCHEDRAFKDFVLGRISRVRNLKPLSERPPMDKDWNTWVTVQLKAHESLSKNQRRALEADYAMRDGVASVRVRKAMLIYTLAQLRV